MHAALIVTRVLEPCLEHLHQKRCAVLLRATLGLLSAGVSSLCGIAQGLSGAVALKHRVKSVDRLLGNAELHGHRDRLYEQVARLWLSLQPLTLNEREQLQGCPTGPLVANLPLLNGRQTGIEDGRKDSLTHMGFFAKQFDLPRCHFPDIQVTQRLELAHATFAD